MADLLVRRDIWHLENDDPWDPITSAYASAIDVLKDRDPEDPTSWSYQAAIHGSDAKDDFRNQCQHNSWFFLPWHRMYLYWFERTIRAAIQPLSDISDEVKSTWALPYWNYDRGGGTARLPPAFREPTLPDGSTENPLFIPERNPDLNKGETLPTGEVPGKVGVTSAAAALRERTFTPPSVPGATAGFGGPVTGWHHRSEMGTVPGGLESSPHNDVHDSVGGLMSGFKTAPLDPVFWLHHANIDRLWTVWLGLGDGRANPSEEDWTGFRFDFHNEAGVPEKQAASAVELTEELGYTYDEVGVVALPMLLGPRRKHALASEPPPDHPPELVGASDEAIELSGEPASVDVPVAAPEGPIRGLDEVTGAGGPSRVYLNVEGIEGDKNPGFPYAVFVNLPDDEDLDTEPESYHAGNVSFFGIEEANDVDRDHPGGHGLRYAFDITDLVVQLSEAGEWDSDQVHVTFSPLRVPPAEGVTEEERDDDTTVRVGRVGIYYQ